MGRLTKAKIDRIIKLRDEGYTQKEVSEKAGVDIKTVRKYDSQKLSRNTNVDRDQVLDLFKRLKWLEENMREMGFARMFGCNYCQEYYPVPEDEEYRVYFCKCNSFDKKTEASQIYHGEQEDEEHYFKEAHIIRVGGRWYHMPTLEECIGCFEFYPKKQ